MAKLGSMIRYFENKIPLKKEVAINKIGRGESPWEQKTQVEKAIPEKQSP